MELYISKSALVAEIERLISNGQTKLKESEERKDYESYVALAERIATCINVLSFIDTLEVKEVNLELENENNNPKITTGTKIRLKTNPNVILSIISNYCHEDEFECSNGSILSLKQIEKYYDIYVEDK